jgi:hypothetical protein
MRKLLLAAALVATTPAAAAAQETQVTVERTDPNPTFGVGMVVGTTVGATGKIYVSRDSALQLSAGGYHFQPGLSTEAAFVWEPLVLYHSRRLRLPFYLGAGTRLSHWQHADQMHTDFALRFPAGISTELGVAPLDLFVEGAFDINVLSEPAPLRRMALTAAVGARYFF